MLEEQLRSENPGLRTGAWGFDDQSLGWVRKFDVGERVDLIDVHEWGGILMAEGAPRERRRTGALRRG